MLDLYNYIFDTTLSYARMCSIYMRDTRIPNSYLG